jgi:hypothetical protein
VRYVPYIALCLAGMALGIAGVVSLGIGAYYGGTLLASLAVMIPIIRREHQAVLREREAMARSERSQPTGVASH